MGELKTFTPALSRAFSISVGPWPSPRKWHGMRAFPSQYAIVLRCWPAALARSVLVQLSSARAARICPPVTIILATASLTAASMPSNWR